MGRIGGIFTIDGVNMPKFDSNVKRTPLLIVFSLFACAIAGRCQSVIADVHVDPRGAYLRVCSNYVAYFPTVIDLRALGIPPGQLIHLASRGSFKFGQGDPAESGTNMLAVFSTSTSLGQPSDQFRVVGAIKAGADTISTGPCGPIDIPEDFFVPTSGVDIRVPTNALFLFVQSADNRTDDNADANNDFVIRISSQCDPCTSISVSQVRICWGSETNALYHVDYQTAVNTNWTVLASNIAGNGALNCIFDSVTAGRRFYRVLRQ